MVVFTSINQFLSTTTTKEIQLKVFATFKKRIRKKISNDLVTGYQPITLMCTYEQKL